jgi:RNA recognition motif-containing protein
MWLVADVSVCVADVAHTVGPRPSDCTTLFVTNLPYDAEEDTVKDAFR